MLLRFIISSDTNPRTAKDATIIKKATLTSPVLGFVFCGACVALGTTAPAVSVVATLSNYNLAFSCPSRGVILIMSPSSINTTASFFDLPSSGVSDMTDTLFSLPFADVIFNIP